MHHHVSTPKMVTGKFFTLYKTLGHVMTHSPINNALAHQLLALPHTTGTEAHLEEVHEVVSQEVFDALVQLEPHKLCPSRLLPLLACAALGPHSTGLVLVHTSAVVVHVTDWLRTSQRTTTCHLITFTSAKRPGPNQINISIIYTFLLLIFNQYG